MRRTTRTIALLVAPALIAHAPACAAAPDPSGEGVAAAAIAGSPGPDRPGPAADAGSPAAAVSVQPASIVPGEPLRIHVTAARAVRGRFNEQALTFIPGPADGDWIAYAGADLDAQPGRYSVALEVTEIDGSSRSQAVDVQVTAKVYPTEELTVAPKYVEPPPEVSARIARESAILKEIWATDSTDRYFDGDVVRPLAGVEGRNFGRRRVFNGKPRSPHNGTDLSAATGTPVEAAAGGVVVLARDLYYSGNLVVLDHGGGVYTLYAHLSELGVEPGQSVAAGDTVGEVGATGRVTGPHLHWGARIGTARVNPASLLALLEFDAE